MAAPNATWFSRHRLAVLGSIAAMLVLTGGYAVVSAVQRVRTAPAGRPTCETSSNWRWRSPTTTTRTVATRRPMSPAPTAGRGTAGAVLVLPYIEQSELHREYSFAEPWDGPNNRKLAGRMPRLYAFHGSDRPGDTVTNYLAVVGDETRGPARSR